MKKIIYFVTLATILIACEDDEYYMEGRITTSNATEITEKSAILNGSLKILHEGNEAKALIEKRGFLIDTTINNLNGVITDNIGREGNFSCNANSLRPSTKYYIRAFATIYYNENSSSAKSITLYGKMIEFTTQEIPKKLPDVQTLPANGFTETGATLNGTIISPGYPAWTERGFAYSRSHNPSLKTGIVAQSYSSSSNNQFTASIIGLSIDTTYYIRAYAKNSESEAYGDELVIFIINQKPKVTILPADNITNTSAKLHGRIDSLGLPPYSEKGFLFSVTAKEPTINDDESLTTKKIVSGSESGEFIYNLSGLTRGVTYYVRTYAINKVGTTYSTNKMSFTTQILPVVTTQEVTNKNISAGIATFNGTIISIGDPAYTERGFVYGTVHNPTIEYDTKKTVLGNGLGVYSLNVTGLQNGNIYYVRAYAINENGSVVYSPNEVSFIFYNPKKPKVTTLTAINVTITSATLRGRIDSLGMPSFNEKGFLYSLTTQEPTINDDENITTKKVVPDNDIGEFIWNSSGLTEGATYWVRAYAKNSVGTVYGTIISVKPSLPDYIILSVEGIAVQKNDISTTSTWTKSSTLCENSIVGGRTDWRLPTDGELLIIYNNKDFIKGFNSSYYWSSTSSSFYYYNAVSFNNGEVLSLYLNNLCYTRCVRTLPKKIIKLGD